MKYLNKYKVFEITKIKEVTCDKCDWNWEIEINDDRKYLCHKCGYDNELKEFDMKSLDKWEKENPRLKLEHFFSWKVFESITSTTGNKVTTYLETGQGSKYLLTDKGETKRWKSEHANTGGEDKGLKEWHQKSFFIDPKFENEANSVLHLTNKGMKISNIGIHVENNKVKIYIIKDGKWVIGNMLDAYPKFGKDSPLVFDCVDNPKIGYNIVEYNLGDNKFSLKNYHLGSPVTKITPIDKLDRKELDFFIKK